MSDDAWYVIQTAPQRELDAAEALRDRGYQVFCPTISKKRRKGKRAQLLALFPRYVFCHYWIPTRDETADIRDKTGRRMISGPVTICGVCEPIPDHVIGKIAEAAARLDMDMEKPRRPLLKVGDIGIIKSGPFEGKQVEILALRNGEAETALKIFNAIRIVRARIEQLEAA